jgi:glucan 1,3-beta-glucosidase
MTWQNIYVLSCHVAFNCTAHGGATGQGTGSISIMDSHFNGVPTGITIDNAAAVPPSIVLDNLLIEDSAAVVSSTSGTTILEGSSDQTTIDSWAMGGAYLDPDGDRQVLSGLVNPKPQKPPELLDGSGYYYTQSKPLYTNVASSDIIVATDHGVDNKLTGGDQTAVINSLLLSNVGRVIFFPAGIYSVEGTVFIPIGSIIVGEGWSQIRGSGSFFEDQDSPNVMVRVGNDGDTGAVQIQDMMFTVQGNTAGCILMEWNVAADSQGAAAMWDSHFRVGGAAGSNLQTSQCATPGTGCKAASLLMHMTAHSSGYFENLWLWVAGTSVAFEYVASYAYVEFRLLIWYRPRP